MLDLRMTQVTSAYTLCRTSQRGPGNTVLPTVPRRQRGRKIRLHRVNMVIKRLNAHKTFGRAPCTLLHAIQVFAAVIIIIINGFIFLEAIIKLPFMLFFFKLYLANVSQCLFHCFSLAINECQSPIEQTLTYLQHRQRSAHKMSLQPHPSQDDFCGPAGCRKVNPGDHAKRK